MNNITIDENVQNLLFVYGTLRKGFENAQFLNSPYKAKYYCNGTIRGSLYDFGDFPAFVKPAAGEQSSAYEIKGEIYKAVDPEILFETLDLIEGYNHQHIERSLFVREKIIAGTEHGDLEAWVYVYNQSLDGGHLIECCDYREYRLGKI